jgi:hypothetical protein
VQTNVADGSNRWEEAGRGGGGLSNVAIVSMVYSVWHRVDHSKMLVGYCWAWFGGGMAQSVWQHRWRMREERDRGSAGSSDWLL